MHRCGCGTDVITIAASRQTISKWSFAAAMCNAVCPSSTFSMFTCSGKLSMNCSIPLCEGLRIIGYYLCTLLHSAIHISQVYITEAITSSLT